MELTENDKILIRQEKVKIQELTHEIYELLDNLKTNRSEIRKKMSLILNHLSTISNYTGSEDKIRSLKADIYDIDDVWSSDGMEDITKRDIRDFCDSANSITFDFTKTDKKITLIGRIKNLTVSFLNFGGK